MLRLILEHRDDIQAIKAEIPKCIWELSLTHKQKISTVGNSGGEPKILKGLKMHWWISNKTTSVPNFDL